MKTTTTKKPFETVIIKDQRFTKWFVKSHTRSVAGGLPTLSLIPGGMRVEYYKKEETTVIHFLNKEV